MMQTFGDEGSLRCLEIVDVWNKLVPPNCTNVVVHQWALREERQKLPKELRAVYDHFRSVFSFHQAENNLTSRRKRYSSQIEPVSKTLGSRIHSVHGCNEQLSWPVLNATENGGNYIVLSPPVEKPERPSNHWSFGWSDLRFYTVEKRTCGYLGNILVIPNTITVGGE
jgi:hypothetical protein